MCIRMAVVRSWQESCRPKNRPTLRTLLAEFLVYVVADCQAEYRSQDPECGSFLNAVLPKV